MTFCVRPITSYPEILIASDVATFAEAFVMDMECRGTISLTKRHRTDSASLWLSSNSDLQKKFYQLNF
jgi:hypothetical protein